MTRRKRLQLGVIMEENDATVLAYIEAAGIKADWEAARAQAKARGDDAMMLFDNADTQERWIINEASMEGDAGFTLVIIPRVVVYHPQVIEMWLRLAHLRKVDVAMSQWQEVHPKRLDRH